jgi:hypothetical protein
MKDVKEMLELISTYQNLDYEEVYVDEAYTFTPYRKIEDLVDEVKEMLPTLSKEDATKLLVHFVKSAEANIKSRYFINTDFREYAAVESARSADGFIEKAKSFLTLDFPALVSTDPLKIHAAFDRMTAMVAHFMMTPRTLVIYKRDPGFVKDEIKTTVSPSTIRDFDPLSEGTISDWKSIFIAVQDKSVCPPIESFNKYMEDHRMVKEYIKNEPKSKNIYKRKGFEKTFNYIKETKQSLKSIFILLALVAIAIIYFMFFN